MKRCLCLNNRYWGIEQFGTGIAVNQVEGTLKKINWVDVNTIYYEDYEKHYGNSMYLDAVATDIINAQPDFIVIGASLLMTPELRTTGQKAPDFSRGDECLVKPHSA